MPPESEAKDLNAFAFEGCWRCLTHSSMFSGAKRLRASGATSSIPTDAESEAVWTATFLRSNIGANSFVSTLGSRHQISVYFHVSGSFYSANAFFSTLGSRHQISVHFCASGSFYSANAFVSTLGSRHQISVHFRVSGSAITTDAGPLQVFWESSSTGALPMCLS